MEHMAIVKPCRKISRNASPEPAVTPVAPSQDNRTRTPRTCGLGCIGAGKMENWNPPKNTRPGKRLQFAMENGDL